MFRKTLMIGLCLLIAGIIGCSKGSQEVEASYEYESSVTNVFSEVDKKDSWGVGQDLIMYEGKEGDIINQVHGEYRWDGNNGSHSGYLVNTSKVADIVAWVKGLFNKGE